MRRVYTLESRNKASQGNAECLIRGISKRKIKETKLKGYTNGGFSLFVPYCGVREYLYYRALVNDCGLSRLSFPVPP